MLESTGLVSLAFYSTYKYWLVHMQIRIPLQMSAVGIITLVLCCANIMMPEENCPKFSFILLGCVQSQDKVLCNVASWLSNHQQLCHVLISEVKIGSA